MDGSDLSWGMNGTGIPIGHLPLYVAVADFPPASTLSVILDAGTNNQALIQVRAPVGKAATRLSELGL